jgi:hypothetical protein
MPLREAKPHGEFPKSRESGYSSRSRLTQARAPPATQSLAGFRQSSLPITASRAGVWFLKRLALLAEAAALPSGGPWRDYGEPLPCL